MIRRIRSRNTNRKKIQRDDGGFRVAGWIRTTLPDIPADYLFDELRDLEAYASLFDDVITLEPYDPPACRKKRKVNKNPQSVWENPAPHRAIHADGVNRKRILPQSGSCFLQKRHFMGKVITVRSQFTRVDEDYDAEQKRCFVMSCYFSDYTLTSTYEVERLFPGPTTVTDDDQLSSSSVATTMRSSSTGSSNSCSTSQTKETKTDDASAQQDGGCRWTLSYAVLPNGWYGKYIFWRHGRAFGQTMRELHAREMESLQKDIRERYQQEQEMLAKTKSTSTPPSAFWCDAVTAGLMTEEE